MFHFADDSGDACAELRFQIHRTSSSAHDFCFRDGFHLATIHPLITWHSEQWRLVFEFDEQEGMGYTNNC